MTDQTPIPADANGDASVAHQKYNQYVTFRVGDSYFSADINSVREITQWQTTTPLPHQRDYTRGVLNLRGTIMPVHDLRARFGGPITEATENHVVVIVCIGEQIVGILVDAVSDIVTVGSSEIRPVPDAGSQERHLLQGLIDTDDGMVAILDLENLFAETQGQTEDE